MKPRFPQSLIWSDILLALATWRISSILVKEDAPFELAAKLRDEIGVVYDADSNPHGTNPAADMFTCIWCMSVWVGWILARGDFLKGLAYSALAIGIDKYINES